MHLARFAITPFNQVADVDGSDATPLGEKGHSPVFSPDGNYIAWSNTDFATGTSVQGDAPYHIGLWTPMATTRTR